ncbi:GumC family protein [Stratiformator vulcanicus]|uniref:Chain length determinant protein n=1 Tax=Stratiformator vulcanicus TaxID=2527980 RepID=A0A517QW51_9PLAN|nr:hypothetical protein [Stratiformator vulcanicus]QDT35895.1 hypothetical protein Pan189_02480 [Stratiformator vulcanicus]
MTSPHSESKDAAAPPPVRAVNDLRAAFGRQWRAMLVFVVGVLTLVTIGLFLCPKTYISESKLLVRVGRESVSLDPTATTGQIHSPSESREYEVTSVLDLLESRSVREVVVETVGADVILKKRQLPQSVLSQAAQQDQTPEQLATLVQAQRAAVEPSPMVREKAIRQLGDDISVSKTKKSNVIAVSCFAESPELAKLLLTLFLDEFRSQYLAAHQTAGSLEFFEEQTDLIGKQFEAADLELQQARNGLVAVSVDRRRDALQEQLSEVELGILRTEADLATSEATLADLTLSLDTLPRKSLTQEVTGFPNDALGMTRRQLYEIEIREKDLLSRFRETHPDVIAIRKQKAEALRIIGQRGGEEFGQETLADDPSWKELQVNLLAERSKAEGLRGRLASLGAQHDQLKLQLQTLNSQAGKVARLVERVELLRNKYGSYEEKLEQTRIDRALLKDRISSLSVAQPPTYVVKAVSPRKGLTLIIAAFLAAVGAFCLAVLREAFAGRPAPWRHFVRGPQPIHFESPDDGITKVSELVEQAAH